MAVDAAFRDSLLNRLSLLGPVTARAMFGGAGLYLEGTIFGLIAGNGLYFKVGDDNRSDYEALGCEPFVPFPDKPYPMSYRRVPDRVIDAPEELRRWAEKSVAESRRAASTRRKNR